ncbi:MAG: diaminopropionate ammonia-lyase [Acidimicrobiales bacterium]
MSAAPTARVVANPLAGRPQVWSPYTRAALEFHRRLPGYRVTPLLSAPSLAGRLGVGEVLVKSETERFGLPAFKMLGASWATYQAVVEHLGEEPKPWETVEELAAALAPLRPFALAAATDGNHGRAVARMAALLGFDAHVFVPAGTVDARIDAIAGEGAEVTVVDGTYDDAVARSAEEAGSRCLVISDTSWPGYERVPRWVVEGYSTMFWEIADRLASAGHESPSVVVVPMGVGALAAATVNHWCREEPHPLVVGVEPTDANCVMASALAGGLTIVPGPHRSIMAGLNCGTPSPVAWPLVSSSVGAFVAVDDDWARDAVRDLAALGVEAGETGAAALAGLAAYQADGGVVERSGGAAGSAPQVLAPDASVLIVCTEGATDPGAWREILGVKEI